MEIVQELLQERKNIQDEISERKRMVKELEQEIARNAFESSGFFLGDMIKEQFSKNPKMIVGFEFYGYNPYFRVLSARVKKDGTPCNRSSIVYGDYEKIRKEKVNEPTCL